MEHGIFQKNKLMTTLMNVLVQEKLFQVLNKFNKIDFLIY